MNSQVFSLLLAIKICWTNSGVPGDLRCLGAHVMSLLFVANFTKEVNPSLAKPPLKYNGVLAKLGLTSLEK